MKQTTTSNKNIINKKLMRKKATSFLALVVTMLFATSAMAQKTFTGSVESYSTNKYEALPITFSLSEVATELGTDTATLVSALAEQVANYADYAVTGVTPMIYNVPNEETKSTYYTQGSVGGFWMDASSVPMTWGTGCAWYNILSWNSSTDAFTFYVGQYPDANKPGDKLTTTFVLEYNEKSVNFNITLNVTEKPAVDVTPVLSKLTIVGEAETTIEQYVRSNFNADAVTVVLAGAAAKLGLDPETLSSNLADYLYCSDYDTQNEIVKDSLTNKSTANGIGWWLADVIDDTTGEPSGECASTAYGSTAKFFVQNFAYKNDTISFELGQYQSTLTAETSYYTYVYLLSGTNAFRVKINFNVLKKDVADVTFDEMTKVGGQEIAYVRNTSLGYSPEQIDLNIDSIAALFGEGVSASDLEFQALTADGTLTDSYNTNATGFWMDMESHQISWSTTTKSFFLDYYYYSDGTYFEIGNMPSIFDGGETTTGSVYLVNGDKYYEFAMKVQMGEKAAPSDYTVATCQTVATYDYEYQIVPTTTNSYQSYEEMDTTIFLDMANIESLLGTSSPVFYGETYADTTGNIFSNKYSCTPEPGFWMAADSTQENRSVVSTWGSTNTYGICFTDSVLQFFQYPGSANAAVGKYYADKYYLVNLQDGKKVQLNVTVKYVAELAKHATAGQEFLAGKSQGEDGFACLTSVDLTAMYTAFDCTAEEFAEAGSWLAPNQSGTYTEENYDALEGFFFDAEGKTVDDGTEIMHVGINEDGQLCTYVLDKANLGNEYKVKFAALYNDQMYYFTVTVNQDGVPTGIEAVEEGAEKSGAIYDLAGHKISKPAKGIYIQNGKKYLAK